MMYCLVPCTACRQHNRFVKGAIEHLEAAGIAAGSVDVIISNCVINLSPDKPAVLREAYRALADGGEVFFSGVLVAGLASESALDMHQRVCMLGILLISRRKDANSAPAAPAGYCRRLL
jgi:ubiquinone/menaquinone biosynthesis C-methylase UbiE